MSETPARPMKFPYTYSAKIAQFPLKYLVSTQWLWKYYGIGLLATVPAIVFIHNLANSPGNKKLAEEAKRKEAAEHHH